MRLVTVVSAALVLIAALRHNDDSDAQLYTVVVRNMVRDDTWTRLSYAPNVHPVFREHLPFGLWPGALALRLGGERALALVAPLFTLGTLATLAWLARRLWLSAPHAVLALISTEGFLFSSAAFRLDAPLVCCALLAAAPALVLERPSWRGASVAVLAVTAATLIKGPFGLVPLVAAGLTRSFTPGPVRLRWLGWTIACALAGSVALGAFLVHAHVTGSDWWSGFAEQQLLASALGTRTDGLQPWWYPARALGEHWWPWLPLTVIGVWSAQRGGVALRLTLWLGLMMCALALPGRKLWHHTLIVFPACALLAAQAIAPLRALLSHVRWLALRAAAVAPLRAPLSHVRVLAPDAKANAPLRALLRRVQALALRARVAVPLRALLRRMQMLARSARVDVPLRALLRLVQVLARGARVDVPRRALPSRAQVPALLEATVDTRARVVPIRARLGLAVIAAAALCFASLCPRGRAVSCTDFAAALERAQPGDAIYVARDPHGAHWREVSTLAAELRLAPWLIDEPRELETGRAAFAVVPVAHPVPGLWTEVARARGWKLLERAGLRALQSSPSAHLGRARRSAARYRAPR